MEITAPVVRKSGGPFAIEKIEIEGIRPDEVLVRVVGTGLCHTDLVVRDQVLPTLLLAILGHEGAGIVEAVSGEVVGLELGVTSF